MPKDIIVSELSKDLASEERQEMESLSVLSVQAMLAAIGGAYVPPRYLRPEEAVVDAVAGHGEAQIPTVTLVILVAWSLWKHRNARVFGIVREQCGVLQLINRIKDELTSWESAHARGSRARGRE
jgi:hypothetical protein